MLNTLNYENHHLCPEKFKNRSKGPVRAADDKCKSGTDLHFVRLEKAG